MTLTARGMPAGGGRRGAVLREMGLGPIWRLRSRQEVDRRPHTDEIVDRAPVVETAEPVAARRLNHLSPPTDRTPAVIPMPADGAVSAAATAGRVVAKSGPAVHLADGMRAQRIATLQWDELEADIRGCRACVLCERRRQAVPGVGDRQARWMLVGEGPGAEEDQRGEPFVGQAGKLLDSMLAAIGLKRGEDVYIANAVKCRPPHNRTPEKTEIAACLPYLERQIALARPRLLIALGRPAAQALLGSDISIAAARGRLFAHQGIPVVVTYHPAYLLRNPQDKAKAWEDLCFARRFMRDNGAG